MLIESDSISQAWAQAFLAAFDHREVAPLVVTIAGLQGLPPEDPMVRGPLDALLDGHDGLWKVGSTASTIFPNSMWQPGVPRTELYRRYNRVFPRLRKLARANQRGTYFHRLIAYGDDEINQLEKIIETWDRGIRRRSALVASIFDPASDHTGTPYLGFPCMHQVCFAQEGSAGLSVTGFYAKQDLAERAYGNYLGLAWLGRFLADALGRDLTRVTCVASVGVLCGYKLNKSALRPLAEHLRNL